MTPEEISALSDEELLRLADRAQQERNFDETLKFASEMINRGMLNREGKPNE